jgi:hypothetical protein
MKSTSSGSGLQRPRHRLDASVGHQAPPDLCLDELAERAEALFELLELKTLRELVDRLLPIGARAGHQTRTQLLEVELAQRTIEVVRTADWPPRLHPRERGDRHGRQAPELVAVHRHQGFQQHRGELFARHLATGAATHCLRGKLLPQLLVERVFAFHARRVQREVHVEDGFERLPVVMVLHERRSERGFEDVALGDVDVLDGMHGVEVLGHRHR